MTSLLPSPAALDRPVEQTITIQDLPPKQAAFLVAYLACLNATRAYMQVYPDTTYDGARASAAALLANLNIRAILRAELDKRAMEVEEIIDRLGEMARADASEFIILAEEPIRDNKGAIVMKDGQPLTHQVTHIDEEMLKKRGYLVKAITPARGGGLRIEMYSAKDALDTLARIRRLVQDAPPGPPVEEHIHIYLPDNQRDAPQDVIEGTVKDAPPALPANNSPQDEPGEAQGEDKGIDTPPIKGDMPII
jgi:hypothetical protein